MAGQSSVGTMNVMRCVHPGTNGAGRSHALMRRFCGSARRAHSAPG